MTAVAEPQMKFNLYICHKKAAAHAEIDKMDRDELLNRIMAYGRTHKTRADFEAYDFERIVSVLKMRYSRHGYLAEVLPTP